MIDEEPHLYRYTNTKSVNLIDNQKSIKNIVKILFEERKEWKFLIEIYIFARHRGNDCSNHFFWRTDLWLVKKQLTYS